MGFTSETYSVADAVSDAKEASEITFISAGYNDYLAGVSLTDFEAAVKEAFEAARSSQPKSTFVYVTPLNLTKKANSLGLTLGDYVASAKKVATSQLVRVADIYTEPKKAFTTLDSNGDPDLFYVSLISKDLKFTERGAKAYLNNIIEEVIANELLYVYGIV